MAYNRVRSGENRALETSVIADILTIASLITLGVLNPPARFFSRFELFKIAENYKKTES